MRTKFTKLLKVKMLSYFAREKSEVSIYSKFFNFVFIKAKCKIYIFEHFLRISEYVRVLLNGLFAKYALYSHLLLFVAIYCLFVHFIRIDRMIWKYGSLNHIRKSIKWGWHYRWYFILKSKSVQQKVYDISFSNFAINCQEN